MTINGRKLELDTARMLQDNMLMQLLADDECVENRSVQKMNMALIDALSELSAKYPVYVKITVDTDDGIIPMTKLRQAITALSGAGSDDSDEAVTAPAFRIAYVLRDKKHVPFTLDNTEVRVDSSGTYTVAVAPERFDVAIYENFEVPDEIGFVMLMHLVARNYCMFGGRMDEAAMFDSRYNDYAEVLSLKRRAHIPARRFV